MNRFQHFDAEALYRNLFGKTKPAGAKPGPTIPSRKPAPEEIAPEPEPEPTIAQPEPGPDISKTKPRVIVKNLAWAVDSATFNEKLKIKLEADLPL